MSSIELADNIQHVASQTADSISVCLSGGGIRSGSVQVGVLKTLSERDMFPLHNQSTQNKVTEISSVSGGGYASSAFYSCVRKGMSPKEASKEIEQRFKSNTNYLFGSGKGMIQCCLITLIGMFHHLVLWFVGCILFANFLFGEVTYEIDTIIMSTSNNSTILNETITYSKHIPLHFDNKADSTIRISNMTDSFQSGFLSFTKLSKLPNDILHADYSSFGLHIDHGLNYLVIVVPVLIYLALSLVVMIFHYCSEHSPKLLSTRILNKISQFFAKKRNGYQEIENKKTSEWQEYLNFFKKTFYGLIFSIVTFVIPMALIFWLTIEVLKFAIFLEAELLKAWDETTTSISHHILNLLYLTMWSVVAISATLVASGVGFSGVGKLISLAIVGFLVIVFSPSMLLLILGHFCLWEIYGENGQFTIVPFASSATQLVGLKVFACIWLLIELLFSSLMTHGFRQFYRTRLTESFIGEDFQFGTKHNGKPLSTPINFIYNCCVNNVSFGDENVHYAFSSDGFCASSTTNELPKCKPEELSLNISTVMSISAAAVSLQMGSVVSGVLKQVVGAILFVFSVNLGDWVTLRPFKYSWQRKVYFYAKILIQIVMVAWILPFFIIDVFYDTPLTWALRVVAVIAILIGCCFASFFTAIKIRNPNDSDSIIYRTFFTIISISKYILSLQMIPFLKNLFLVLGFKQNSLDESFFMTDGGHFENLGLFNLLKERRKKILSFDASEDGKLKLSDLYNCLALASKFNIIDFNSIRFYSSIKEAQTCDENTNDDKDYALDGLADITNWSTVIFEEKSMLVRTSQKNFVVVKFNYLPSNGKESTPTQTGFIWYAKSTLTGNEPGMVKLYHFQASEFPHHPTYLQLFSEEDFLAYEKLGEKLANTVLDDLNNILDHAADN